MIIDSKAPETAALLEVANRMCVAPRTDPKATGMLYMEERG